MPAPKARSASAKTKVVNGRTVSAKSRTGSAACSQAMSDWVRTRKAGTTPASVYAQLGKCRSMARAGKQATQHRAAGNEAKAQRYEALAAGKKGPISAKDRLARAKELRAELNAKRAGAGAAPVAAKAAETPPKAAPSSRESNATNRAKAYRQMMGESTKAEYRPYSDKQKAMIAAESARKRGSTVRADGASRGVVTGLNRVNSDTQILKAAAATAKTGKPTYLVPGANGLGDAGGRPSYGAYIVATKTGMRKVEGAHHRATMAKNIKAERAAKIAGAPSPASPSPKAPGRGTPERLAEARVIRAGRKAPEDLGVYNSVPAAAANKRTGPSTSLAARSHQRGLVSRLNIYERTFAASSKTRNKESLMHHDAMMESGLTGDGLLMARAYSGKKLTSAPGVLFPSPAAPAVPRPSLKDQAAAHRASKGTTAERAKKLNTKLQGQYTKLINKQEDTAKQNDLYVRVINHRQSDLESFNKDVKKRVANDDPVYRQELIQSIDAAKSSLAAGQSGFGQRHQKIEKIKRYARRIRSATDRAPAPSPPRPSLRQQADAARAAKGTTAERAERLMNLAANKGGNFGVKASQLESQGLQKRAWTVGYSGKVDRGSFSAMKQKSIREGDLLISKATELKSRANILGRRAAKIHDKHLAAPAPSPARPSLRQQADAARAGKGTTALRKALATEAKLVRNYSLSPRDATPVIRDTIGKHIKANTPILPGYKPRKTDAKRVASGVNEATKAKAAEKAKADESRRVADIAAKNQERIAAEKAQKAKANADFLAGEPQRRRESAIRQLGYHRASGPKMKAKDILALPYGSHEQVSAANRYIKRIDRLASRHQGDLIGSVAGNVRRNLGKTDVFALAMRRRVGQLDDNKYAPRGTQDRITSARKLAELRKDSRLAAPSSSPSRPSLRQQADAARAAKGTTAERAARATEAKMARSLTDMRYAENTTAIRDADHNIYATVREIRTRNKMYPTFEISGHGSWKNRLPGQERRYEGLSRNDVLGEARAMVAKAVRAKYRRPRTAARA